MLDDKLDTIKELVYVLNIYSGTKKCITYPSSIQWEAKLWTKNIFPLIGAFGDISQNRSIFIFEISFFSDDVIDILKKIRIEVLRLLI